MRFLLAWKREHRLRCESPGFGAGVGECAGFVPRWRGRWLCRGILSAGIDGIRAAEALALQMVAGA